MGPSANASDADRYGHSANEKAAPIGSGPFKLTDAEPYSTPSTIIRSRSEAPLA